MIESNWMELLKKDMIEAINVLNFENLDIQKELLEKHFNVFQSLQELHSFKNQHHLISNPITLNERNENILTEERSEQMKKEAIIEKKEKMTTLTTKPMYRFERKIKGGFVPEIEGFVPEGIVRKLGIQHGDMVYASPMETDDLNSRHFRYEIAQKGEGKDASDRVQFNYCPVKKEAGRLVVEKSEETGQYIRYEDSLYTVILDEFDVQEHQIKEGALIDIAFPVGKPNLAKVLWTHKVAESENSFNSNHQSSNSAKKVEKTEKKDKPSFEQTLEGKTVLVIGNEPKKNLYKLAVEQRGGTFLWSDAKEKLIRLESLIRKSDLVVFLLSVSGHVGMEHIKQMCKDHRVSFETTWSKGQTNLIRIAEEKIEPCA